MKQISTLIVGAIFALTVMTACTSSAAPISISRLPETETAQTAAVDNHDHAAEQDNIARISQADAKKDFEAGNVVFVDTRGDTAYKAEHIKGAISVPMSDFAKNYKKIPPGKKIIAYCSCPNEETSGEVVRQLGAKGIKNAFALTGGIQGWKAGNNPVEANK